MIKRSQGQIFFAFLLVHIVLTCIAGFAVWQLIDSNLRSQAEGSARSVARLLTEGGFSVNDDVLQRMQRLTGYKFIVQSEEAEVAEGLVVVSLGDASGRVVAIDYQSQGYQDHVELVFWSSMLLLFGGIIIFVPVAWFLAKKFSRPLEHLAHSADEIGAGNWQTPIEVEGAEEIENVSASLERMRLQLAELDKENRQAERLATLGTFTATIAHEVRNPLSAVRLMIQMLEKSNPDERYQHINDELERLDLIVDELLGYSAGMQIELAECRLSEIAQDIINLLQRQADHAGVRLRCEGSAQVSADARRLRQLLMNLVLNAIQAQSGEGDVLIKIQADGFEVIDQGPGVPDDLVEDLFAPFHSRRQKGTGLGLHLASSIAQAHNAELTYQRDEQGTCFRVCGLQAVE